jgi:hypothetical protein
MRITWMDKVTNKEILERKGLPSMERISDGLDTKIGYLLSTVFWSQKERAPSSPVQGYHQKKPEAERHKDQLMDITHSREKNGTH